MPYREFLEISPFMDDKKPKQFCQDSFEICWIIAKAYASFKAAKR